MTISKRKEESSAVMEKYPNRIPIIVETDDFILEKHKYLVPKTISIGEFIQLIRKKTNLKPTEAIFFLINNKMPPINAKLYDLYDEEKSECGFLFIHAKRENVFGN